MQTQPINPDSITPTNAKEQSMLTDLKKCLTDKVAIHSWLEDTMEEPTAYEDYTTDELKSFLFKHNIPY